METRGIVLMCHGSARLEATEKVLTLVEKRIAQDYPKALVLSAFSSMRIRSVLRKRGIEIPSPREEVDLLGHGTEHEAGTIYMQLEQCICAAYPINIWVSTLEEGVEAFLLRSNLSREQEKVVIIPLLWMAANHVRKDMIDKEDSWKKRLEHKGYNVEVIEKGLGEYIEVVNLLFPVTFLSQ